MQLPTPLIVVIMSIWWQTISKIKNSILVIILMKNCVNITTVATPIKLIRQKKMRWIVMRVRSCFCDCTQVKVDRHRWNIKVRDKNRFHYCSSNNSNTMNNNNNAKCNTKDQYSYLISSKTNHLVQTHI